jgi:hypothetical protein
LEIELVRVVDEAVQDGVGDGGVADPLVPAFAGKLAGDHRGSGAVAVFEDLEQVMPLGFTAAVSGSVVAHLETFAAKQRDGVGDRRGCVEVRR